MKDTLLTLSSVLALGALGTGCLVDRGPLQGGGTDDDAGEVAADVTLPPDAHVDPGTDADLDAFSADAYADDAFSPDAYADDAYAPDACLVRCDGLDRVVCEGSSAEVRETCKLGCVDAPTPRCRRMITSNFGSSSVFDLGSSDLIIDAPTTINTDTMGEHVRQRDTSEVSRMVHGTIRISSTLTVIGSRPLVLIARDRIEVSGTIELSASGATPGPGGLAGGSTVGADATTPRAG
ncbi:MAG: hypothetical protein J0L92_28690, partial [Deltaproteobacteria bacterium]|nr:hypothetical protein [Deltaproteobacteria bacterium]